MKLLLVVCGTLFAIRALSADFYLTQDNLWFDKDDRTSVSAVVELRHVSLLQMESVFKTQLPANIYHRATFEESQQYGEEFIRVTFSNMHHADLLMIKEILPNFVRLGAKTLTPEIPMAPRIKNLKGHDDFVAAVSGLPLKTVVEIDEAVERAHITGHPIVVRYYLDDREKGDPKDFEHLKKFNGDAVVTYIPANTFGQMPLYVPGHSIVFHARTFHGRSILGSLNPGLVNANIAQALTANKYVEALFWKQYAPEALPETHLLSSMDLELSNPARLTVQLDKMFPQGWVMKGVSESSSNFSIITDKTKLAEEIEAYRNSDFDKFKEETYRKMAGYDEDNIYETLQRHKNYLGWRASLYLKKPSNVIVQRKADIDREFRVESIGGRILKKATIDRHNWWLELIGQPFEVSSPEAFEKVNNFAQSIVDKLPPELRETNFGFDIALLKNGHCIAIESNAGSESGFLINQDTSVEALNQYLERYPSMKSNKEIRAEGLSSEEQMKYLNERFKAWGIDVRAQYPNYEMNSSEVKTDFEAVKVPAEYVLSNHSNTCDFLLGDHVN
jgi:hypothetical protein